MEKKELLLKMIPDQGILPLYFYKDTTVSINVLRSLYKSGIRIVEYTNRGEAALNNFREMRKVCDKELSGMYLGVGTVKNRESALEYVAEGADFIVSPGLVKEVFDVADKHNLLYLPGCMTPSEIISAENMGAQIIKLFPGSLLGPGFLKAIKSIFPHLLFMPTGGVSLERENIKGWFDAGVCAVGMGSKLVRKDLLESGDYSKIEELTKEVIEIIQSVR